MNDVSLIRHTLAVMKLYDGRPTWENTIATDCELQSGRPLNLYQVQQALQFLRDQGMVASRQDSFQRVLWTITETGRSANL